MAYPIESSLLESELCSIARMSRGLSANHAWSLAVIGLSLRATQKRANRIIARRNLNLKTTIRSGELYIVTKG